MLIFQDELNAELEELEQEDLDEQMLNIDKTPDLPSVPETELPATKKKAPAAAQGGKQMLSRKFLSLNFCSRVVFVVFVKSSKFRVCSRFSCRYWNYTGF